MKCLRCKTTELELQVRGDGADIVEVDFCSDCQGMWLDAKELDKLDDNFFLDVERFDFEQVDASVEDTSLECPRCEGTVLTKVHPAQFKLVVLDTCPSCKGFWLDKGELEKVQDVSDRMLIASLLDLDD